MGFWTVWFCVEFVLVSAQPKAHTHSCTGVATFHFPFFAFKTRPCLKGWLHYIQNVLNCALRCVSTAGGSWAALFVLLKCGACWHQEDGHTIVPLFHIPPFKQKEEYHLFFFSLFKARAACSDCLLYTETVQSFLCRNVIPNGNHRMPQSYLKGGDQPTMLG